MSDESRRAIRNVTDAIAYACEHLDALHAVLPDQAAPLADLADAVRGGGDPAGALDALHDALLAAGDALGVFGQSRGFTPVGVERSGPREDVYVCPARRCSRYCWPGAGVDAPMCHLTGRPLSREEL